MAKIKLTVAYEGTNYHGFQRQANAQTVQEVIERALDKLYRRKITVIGAARTDAGVHARDQVLHIPAVGTVPIDKLPVALNSALPDDIVVVHARLVDDGFHARYSAKRKLYSYRILNQDSPDPFMRNTAWHIRRALNIENMTRALPLLEGEHDFSSFRASGGEAVSPVRTLYRAMLERNGPLLQLSFLGNGFLYHMVRNLVGTLVQVGRGEMMPADVGRILAARDRRLAGPTAPPQGLCLERVDYDE